MMINHFLRRDVWPMRSHCSCPSIAERTGTANGMAMAMGAATGTATAGTATGVTATGMGTGGDVDIVMG
jgi:hypothetical protein